MLHLDMLIPAPRVDVPTRVVGRRPVGDQQCMAFRRHMAAADAHLSQALAAAQQGALSVTALATTLQSTLIDCCNKACPLPRGGKGRVTSVHADWFDEECQECRAQLQMHWQALLDLGGTRAVPEDHPVWIAAHTARRNWSTLKRRKRREHAQQHQQQLMLEFAGGDQKQAWRLLKGTRPSVVQDTDVEGWTQHFQCLYGAQPPPLQLTQEQLALKQQLLSTQQHDGGDAAQQLNTPITPVEVLAAAAKLRNGKAADAAGLTCELLRYALVGVGGKDPAIPDGAQSAADVPRDGPASEHLVDCLVQLLNDLPKAQPFPDAVAVSKLVPVPKKGCVATDRNTYRGIAVSAILGQLYDVVLHDRKHAYVESQGLRAPVQCGFRQEHGTLDALFVMQHLLSKHRHARRPLYVCYVDFVKAFDMVRREEIVARAQQLGIHGEFLVALEQWLMNSSMSVCVNGEQGAPFPTYRGTKQGSRLSPLCFGLFIEQLHHLLRLKVPGAGPMLGTIRVPDIMYADDVKLLASSASELQQLLDVLDLFCTLFDMQVNIKPQKTCVVVYMCGVGARRVDQVTAHKWRLQGRELPVCTSYTDLGIMCTSRKGLSGAPQQLAAAGRKAMHALLTMCRKHHLVQPAFKLRLFDALVEPVLSYGCQVWGPWAWNMQQPLHGDAEAVQQDFLRIMAGVGKTVKKEMLTADFARYPVAWHWVALAARLWNALARSGDPSKLAVLALKQDILLMVDGCKDCWCYRLLDTLSQLQVVSRSRWDHQANLGVPVSRQARLQQILSISFDEQSIKAALREKFDGILVQAQAAAWNPRNPGCPSKDIMLATYLCWVRAQDLSRKPLHLRHRYLSHKQLQTICRARLGWHDLEIQTGRFHGVDRHLRLCKLCQALGHKDENGREFRGDLLHHLVECWSLHHIREKFPDLFKPEAISSGNADTLARYILNHKDQLQVSVALQALRAGRDKALRLLEDTGESIIPDGYVPVDPALERLEAVYRYHDLKEQGLIVVDWY